MSAETPRRYDCANCRKVGIHYIHVRLKASSGLEFCTWQCLGEYVASHRDYTPPACQREHVDPPAQPHLDPGWLDAALDEMMAMVKTKP